MTDETAGQGRPGNQAKPGYFYDWPDGTTMAELHAIDDQEAAELTDGLAEVRARLAGQEEGITGELCRYSLEHYRSGVLATTTMNTWVLGLVPACSECATRYLRQEQDRGNLADRLAEAALPTTTRPYQAEPDVAGRDIIGGGDPWGSWARSLNDKRLAHDLDALACDIRWCSVAERSALLREAAYRLRGGEQL